MREAGTDETGEMEEGPAAASDREWGVAESEGEGGAAESWEIRVREMIFWRERVVFIPRNFFFFLIILDAGRVRVGPGRGFKKTRTRPGPGSGFFKKTQTRPYSLSDRVKSGPLGSGRTGYPRIG